MILSGLKQIFKLTIHSAHTVLFIFKCPRNGMYGSLLWAGKMILFSPVYLCFYFACNKRQFSNPNNFFVTIMFFKICFLW